MAFAVINPVQGDVLYKSVLTRISGEPQTAMSQKLTYLGRIKRVSEELVHWEKDTRFSCEVVI